MEHVLNELEDLFQSLVRRMNKSEMEDFELVIALTLIYFRFGISCLTKLECIRACSILPLS